MKNNEQKKMEGKDVRGKIEKKKLHCRFSMMIFGKK